MLNPIRMTEFGLKGLLRFLWRKKLWIFGLLSVAAFVVTGFYWLFIRGGCDNPNRDASLQMGHIEQSLDMYYARTSPHEYPEHLDQLVGMRIMQDIPNDPWDEPYVYIRVDEKTYVLLCKGADRSAGTEDDIIAGVEPQ